MPKQLLGDIQDLDLSFKVNKGYAKKFEHNKQREELHRLQEKHPELAARLSQKQQHPDKPGQWDEGVDEDESSSEEEDLGEIPEETEEAILETLLRIKRKDPLIYKPDVHFFSKDEEDEEEKEQGGAGKTGAVKKAKPLYLKDVLAKQALEHGPDVSSDDDSGGTAQAQLAQGGKGKAYDAEQEQLRRAFLSAADEVAEQAEGEFGALMKRETADTAGPDEHVEEDGRGSKGKKGKKNGKQLNKLAAAYFESGAGAADSFLREYILNKGWVDKSESGYIPSYDEVVGTDGVDDEEDEQHLEAAEDFEAAYNFRFEEPGGINIAGHPRVVEGTVRKEDDRRKRQRAEKAARLREQDEQRQSEVKRLKNLKKKEIEAKVSTLQRVAGAAAPCNQLVDELLEGDFDPDAWDKQMAAAFDDDFYEAHDEEMDGVLGDDDLDDGEFDAGLVDLQGEGEEGGEGGVIAGLGVGADDDAGGEGEGGEGAGAGTFRELRKKLAGLNAGGMDGDELQGNSKAAAEKLAQRRAEVQQLLEEYYHLDYEDTIAGMPTRFRYREVPALTLGLSAEDVLLHSDKDLNQVAGLRRLAPYREDALRLRPNYKALQELRQGQHAPGGALWKPNRKQHKERSFKKGQRQPGHGAEPGRPGEEGKKESGQQQEEQRARKRQKQKGGNGGGSAAVAVGSEAPGGGTATQPLGAAEDVKQGAERRKEPKAQDGAGAKQQGAVGEGKAKVLGKRAAGSRPQPGSNAPRSQEHSAKKRKGGRQVELDPQAARMASYAKLELKPRAGKGSGAAEGKGKRAAKSKESGGKDAGAAAAAASDGPKLSKAQKKNLRRTKKRAAKETPPAS